VSVPQLPLALRAAPAAGLSDFVGSAATVQLLRAVASGERSDWVYLHGPQGSGRSHLLLATLAQARQAGREVVYLPLGRMRMAEPLDAAPGAALVAVDDLEAAAGNTVVERALFALHNRCFDEGGQMLYGALEAPAELSIELPDLRSRLQQCSRFALRPLDETERRALLRERAQQRGLELDEPVLDFLFRRYPRDLGALLALLERLDRESLAAQRRITVPFLRGLLGPSS
jgi:DnaA family protein